MSHAVSNLTIIFPRHAFFRIFAIMKRYGLIGKKLGHSWSKRWFDTMFARLGICDAEYQIHELHDIGRIRQWASEENMSGFNVTIPYKESIIPFLDGLDAEALHIGAINCVEISGTKMIGHNTDAPAFTDTLRPLLQPWHTHALVLGTGGAAKAVTYALRRLGIDSVLVSRFPNARHNTISYDEALDAATHTYLIVNCTPAGMYPHNHTSPWTQSPNLCDKHLCYDLVYNPPTTRFLQTAIDNGAAVANGLPMLERQAQLSWDIWRSSDPPRHGIPHAEQ